MFRKIILLILISGVFWQGGYAQSEAGAIFLLISPGARAGGMGETHVAVANDAFASYWNPAGLAFLKDSEIGIMHVNWLPNLADDIYYEFLAYRQYIPNLGTIGGHIIYLNLGEQIRTDEYNNQLGTFSSFMAAVTGSWSTRLSRDAALGLNMKIIHQDLSPVGAGAEKGKGASTNLGFDVGYMKRNFLVQNLSFGMMIANIGNKIAFIDAAQADPMPTNLKLGFNWEIVKEKYNSLSIAYDMNKLLVASYPDRDVDGDELVGGYDKDGNIDPSGEYNKNGIRETAHSDDWWLGIFTSWVNDWLLTYDSASDGIGQDVGNGLNKHGEKADEDGNTDDGSLSRELESITHNLGVEYWYSNTFAIRFGFIYDKQGKLVWKGKWPIPTFGAGIRFFNFGFDLGYISGDPGHPLQNTLRVSLNMQF